MKDQKLNAIVRELIRQTNAGWGSFFYGRIPSMYLKGSTHYPSLLKRYLNQLGVDYNKQESSITLWPALKELGMKNNITDQPISSQYVFEEEKIFGTSCLSETEWKEFNAASGYIRKTAEYDMLVVWDTPRNLDE